MTTDNKDFIPALKYDWLTKVYDPVLQLTMPERKFKSALINQMNIQPNHRVLDFGSGSGTLTMMAARSNPQAEFHGVDVDGKILTMAEKKLKGANLLIQLVQYNGKNLPYPDNHFDRVMSSLVFHHLTLAQKYFALKEIYRVLKPSGEIHIADFGKPVNIMQRVAFMGVQLLDGFGTTGDNVTGRLSNAVEEVFPGFQELSHFQTAVGTVRLLKGTKKKKSVFSIL